MKVYCPLQLRLIEKLLRITTNGNSRIFSPKEVSALFAGCSTESDFEEGLSGVILFRILFELGPDEGFDFLGLN